MTVCLSVPYYPCIKVKNTFSAPNCCSKAFSWLNTFLGKVISKAVMQEWQESYPREVIPNEILFRKIVEVVECLRRKNGGCLKEIAKI